LTRLAVRFERLASKNFIHADTRMEWKQASAAQYLEMNQHFYAWLRELVVRLSKAGCPPTTPSHADERALRAAHLLNTLPMNEPWTLDSLAGRTGLSPAHLTRLFVEAFDTTPKHYHLERRKRAAARLLEEEQLPIKQIAPTLGFTSACYFTAWFRTHFGTPPGQWRKSRGKNRRHPA
jgi:AraC-like DNA-binding protein